MREGHRILVVDDDKALAESLSDILEELGNNCVVALTGEDAVKRVGEDAFDYVLMDIMLPRMNGVDAFREVKNISPETKVILMTGYSVEDLIQKAFTSGVEGVLFKPFDIDSLLELIRD
ncbi:MAG: response regulator [Candidatus Omnitrophica bacterium]|nr:response regulator [Candidatus Omnitrophota bacterium]